MICPCYFTLKMFLPQNVTKMCGNSLLLALNWIFWVDLTVWQFLECDSVLMWQCNKFSGNECDSVTVWQNFCKVYSVKTARRMCRYIIKVHWNQPPQTEDFEQSVSQKLRFWRDEVNFQGDIYPHLPGFAPLITNKSVFSCYLHATYALRQNLVTSNKWEAVEIQGLMILALENFQVSNLLSGRYIFLEVDNFS